MREKNIIVNINSYKYRVSPILHIRAQVLIKTSWWFTQAIYYITRKIVKFSILQYNKILNVSIGTMLARNERQKHVLRAASKKSLGDSSIARCRARCVGTAARRTSTVGPRALKERESEGAVSHTRGPRPPRRRESRREEVSISRDTPRGPTCIYTRTGWSGRLYHLK